MVAGGGIEPPIRGLHNSFGTSQVERLGGCLLGYWIRYRAIEIVKKLIFIGLKNFLSTPAPSTIRNQSL